MKSKTSFFNVTIFKKNLSQYWPVWAVFLCYLLCMLPLRIWSAAADTNFYIESAGTMVSAAEKQYQTIGNAIHEAIMPTVYFFFAMAAALIVFSYLNSAKTANMIHALPVSRMELYVTNYVSGLLFLIVPELIAFLTAVIVCLANQFTAIEYLLWWLLCTMGVSFFAYSMAVFVAMFTGLSLAMPFYYLIVNFLYVGCHYLIFQVESRLCYGLTDGSWNLGKSGVLSPMYYLADNLNTRLLYEEESDFASGISVSGGNLAAAYAAVGIIFVILAYQLYKRRQLENAGDLVSIGIVKPVFRWGMAFCCGLLFALLVTGIVKNARVSANDFICMLIAGVIGTAIFFWLAEMLLQKNFKVFTPKRFLEWTVLAVLSAVFLMMFEFDLFGIERRLPKEDEIEMAFIDMDFPIIIEQENYEKLLEVHRQIINEKKNYQANEKDAEGKYYYTTIRYYLKNGSNIERRYAVPVQEAYLSDETSPAAQIISWETDAEKMKMQMFGQNYTENRYYEGCIELYNENGENRNYYFNQDELKKIVKAMEADIEEGNYDAYQLASTQEKKESYRNELYLSSYNYNKDNLYDMWSYCYNYRTYQQKDANAETVVERNRYFTFGPECVHTVNALKDCGILGEEWHLYTKSEYDKVQTKQ